MNYNYDQYQYQMCTLPIIISLIILSAMIPTIVLIVQIIWKKKKLPYEWMNRIDEMTLLFGVIIMSVILSANVIKLARGGIFLLEENPEDSIHITGEIEKCVEIDSFTGAKYGVEENNGYGEGIVVNGFTYWLTTYKDLKEGDYISAEVLPKSRFVLKWEKQEKASIENWSGME